MTLFQRRIIYVSYLPPGARQPPPLADVPKHSLQGEEIVIRQASDRVRLQGYLFEKKGATTTASGPIILYFQGNAGNMLHRIPVFERMLSQLPASARIVAVHTRGYGGSNGWPTQSNLRADALRILDYTLQRYTSPAALFVYGHSLGGAVAVHLAVDAARHYRVSPIRGIILENTFTCMEDLVGAVYPRWMPYRHLARYCLYDRWDTLRAIRETGGALPPTLLLAGSKDELVPSWMMQRIARTIETTVHSPPPIYHAFPHGLHENVFLQPGYSQAIARFIERTMTRIHR
ncbi:Alpha/Beta hydrolase protein [Syncephalis pseudoplumigaleata]|uniref:Alpha/Beta hydrolase protein n=1 Tax=Syncephalis pseudoplumigaleata TaxID=1712513 RepID=A0A4V1J274_9FUNG|nr:Alpha/Beta hydrolase protein [Syncephalis pseudoplumigaleata]|eukprot:RKP27569.1 Alpha/Beta hydrolase protein [Syncephalis pseudoplumigaleata]